MLFFRKRPGAPVPPGFDLWNRPKVGILVETTIPPVSRANLRMYWLAKALLAEKKTMVNMVSPSKDLATRRSYFVEWIWMNQFPGWAKHLYSKWRLPVRIWHFLASIISMVILVVWYKRERCPGFAVIHAWNPLAGLAAVISGFLMGYSPVEMVKTYGRTLYAIRNSLLTISAMLALGYTTRYSGLDTTLGLAFANSGFLYPFFGTFLGWLGVALTGSDTASNVLFGSLQKVSSEQLGLPPVLMAAANSSGGVMGKMIDAQSIVVAAVATKWHGHEGKILRFVIWHSLALTALVGLLIMAQAYLWPFTQMVIGR